MITQARRNSPDNSKNMDKLDLSFDSYLRGVHATTYHGMDDNMSDAFEKWITEFDVNEMNGAASEYGKIMSTILI